MQALASQYELLCNLIDRNAAQRAGGEQRDDEAVVPLPFILLQAGPQAAMDVRLSTDECDALLDYGRCAQCPCVGEYGLSPVQRQTVAMACALGRSAGC